MSNYWFLGKGVKVELGNIKIICSIWNHNIFKYDYKYFTYRRLILYWWSYDNSQYIYWVWILKYIYISQLKNTLKEVMLFFLAQGLKPEPLNVELENSRFAHDCTFHWLHRQGNTFLPKDSSQVYLILGMQNHRYTYYTYDIISRLSSCIQITYSYTIYELTCSLAMRAVHFNL